jgi:hypothetical protein
MKTSMSEAGENRGKEVRVPPAMDHGHGGVGAWLLDTKLVWPRRRGLPNAMIPKTTKICSIGPSSSSFLSFFDFFASAIVFDVYVVVSDR